MTDAPLPGRRPAVRTRLEQVLAENALNCTECGACVKQCAFLQRSGTPRSVALAHTPEAPGPERLPFGCSLCGLCTAICPEGVDPCALFLELRREAVRCGGGVFPQHRRLRDYERRGTSKRFSFYALPEGCDTVFFPGCSLAGTRASRTHQVFEVLRGRVPNLGVVLDCCTKPSHDLGRQAYFSAMFDELREYLLTAGVRRVLVACPNCYRVFREHGKGLTAETVYEALDQLPLPQTPVAEGTVTVHDPCVARFEPAVQAAVRRLLERAGLDVVEMRSAGRRTLCCGEGGAVGLLEPDLARTWSRERVEQAAGRRVATYCAGCVQQLDREAPASHVLDLLLDPEAALAGRAKVARAPRSYLDRLALKRHLAGQFQGARTRERTFTVREGGFLQRLRQFLRR